MSIDVVFGACIILFVLVLLTQYVYITEREFNKRQLKHKNNEKNSNRSERT